MSYTPTSTTLNNAGRLRATSIAYPTKLSHQRFAVEAVTGHNRTHALQHDRTVKQVRDLPVGACYRSAMIQCA
jgi:hypothetical protein